jgi:hypothetical protein
LTFIIVCFIINNHASIFVSATTQNLPISVTAVLYSNGADISDPHQLIELFPHHFTTGQFRKLITEALKRVMPNPCGLQQKTKLVHTECNAFDGRAEGVHSWHEITRLYVEHSGQPFNLYLVAPDDLYILPRGVIGDTITLRPSYLASPIPGQEIQYVRLSNHPRVFELNSFITDSECSSLISRTNSSDLAASAVYDESTRTSITESIRTSFNTWDSDSPEAVQVLHRAFTAVGMQFDDNKADGLQILRYQTLQAYAPHMDWFDIEKANSTSQTTDGVKAETGMDSQDMPKPGAGPFNYDPANGGSNRFVTVFIYLSPVELGGQTVFTRGEMPDLAVTSLSHLRSRVGDENEYVRAAEQAGIQRDSWQHSMVQECASKLAVSRTSFKRM